MRIYERIGARLAAPAIVLTLLLLGACGGKSGSTGTPGGTTSGLPQQDSLSTLGASGIDTLCTWQAELEKSLKSQLQDFRCLVSAVTTAKYLSEGDKTSECEKSQKTCLQVSAVDAPTSTLACSLQFEMLKIEGCAPLTVAEFEACTKSNLDLEIAKAQEQKGLTCADALADGSKITVSGKKNCVCKVEVKPITPDPNDLDGDGVPNDKDKCPDSPIGLVDENGCPPQQDSDGDGVPDSLDKCPDTAPGATVDENGCSPDQDKDGDKVPDADDKCPDTAPGATVNAQGCSPQQDEDGDGVPNALDACPFTEKGAGVDYQGCSPLQVPVSTDPIVTQLPGDTLKLTVTKDVDNSVTFHAPKASVSETSDGYQVKGTVLLELPDGYYLALTNADLAFTYGPDINEGLQDVSGAIDLAIPAIKLLAGIKIAEPIKASFGFGKGDSERLAALNAPLDPSRYYLFFTFKTELKISAGLFTFTVPSTTNELVVVVDPSDPAYYLRGKLSKLGPVPAINNIAVGMSSNGHFKFEPNTTWKVEEWAKPFSGHMVLEGDVPLSSLPGGVASLVMTGKTMLDLDPDLNGKALWQVDGGPIKIGFNGTVSLTLSMISDLPISAILGNASAGAELWGDKRLFWVTGTAGLTQLTMPVAIPLTPISSIQAAAVIDEASGTKRLDLAGSVRFLGSKIVMPITGWTLNDVDISGSLTVDSGGFHIIGTTSDSFVDQFTYGSITVEATINGFTSWYFKLTGTMKVGDKTATLIEIGSNGKFDIDGVDQNPPPNPLNP